MITVLVKIIEERKMFESLIILLAPLMSVRRIFQESGCGFRGGVEVVFSFNTVP